MQTQYIRKGNTIFGADVLHGDAAINYDNIVFQGFSINDAKRKSRELQGKDLGHGVVRIAG